MIMSQFAKVTSSLNCFIVALFLLLSSIVYLLVQVSCEYHYKFRSYDNMFIRELPEIRKSEILSSEFAQYLETGDVRDTKFSTNFSNEKLMDGAKRKGDSFYRFCVINRKPTEGFLRVKLPHPSPNQVRINMRSDNLAYYWA